MKKTITIFTIAILLISCGKSKEEQMMYDFNKENYLKSLDMNIDNSDFKIISIEKVKDITTKDSLDILQPYFEAKQKEKLSQLDETLRLYKQSLETSKKGLETAKYPEYKELYAKRVSRDENDIRKTDSIITIYKNDCKGTFLEKTYADIQNYKSNPNTVLTTQYKGTYEIKAPAGIMTYTYNYYTNREGTEFVESEKIK